MKGKYGAKGRKCLYRPVWWQKRYAKSKATIDGNFARKVWFYQVDGLGSVRTGCEKGKIRVLRFYPFPSYAPAANAVRSVTEASKEHTSPMQFQDGREDGRCGKVEVQTQYERQ